MVAVVLLRGAIGVRHHCYSERHARLQACLSLLVLLWRAAGSAVWCCVGGEGAGGGDGSGWSGAGGHPPALGQEAGEPRGPLAPPQLPVWVRAHGSGPPGVVGWCWGESDKVDPVTAVTSCVRRKACTPTRASGIGRGGPGTGAATQRWMGVTPRIRSGSARVLTMRMSRQVPGRSCQRTCPLWWGPLVLDRVGDRLGSAKPRGAGGLNTRWALWGTPPTRRRTGGSTWCRRILGWSGGGGGRLARAFHEHRDFAYF